VIRLDNVSKVYASKAGTVRALDGVSLHVAPGEFVAVCGPSGCGKSTLLLVSAALTSVTSGSVVVDAVDLASLSSFARAEWRGENVGFVFQMFHLLPYLNVLENVRVAARGGGSTRRASDLLERCGLSHRLRHRPDQLSVGERQRVAVARALVNEPRLILADEPTGNLDPANAAIVLEMLAAFHREGGTVLLVTHDESAAKRAGRIVRLENGRVVGARS
jgi:ABC-type lipoprotein export system ATPase subunit